MLGKYITSNTLSIRDVFPVCHSHPTKPLLDTSFQLAEVATKTSGAGEGLGIVGWYTCQERADDNTASAASHRIIRSLSARNPDREPILMVLDNQALGDFLISAASSGGASSPLLVYGKDGRSHAWTREVNLVDTTNVKEGYGKKVLETEVLVWDFEHHLESRSQKEIVERDWMGNKPVVTFVDTLAS